MQSRSHLPQVPSSIRLAVYGVLAFGVAVLLGAGTLLAEDMPNPAGPCVRTSLLVEQMRGEALRATLTIVNQSVRPLSFRFASAQRYDLVLLYEGQEAWRWSTGKVFAPMAEELVLHPGEKWEFAEEAPLNVFPPFGNTGRCVVHFHLADRFQSGAMAPFQFGEQVVSPALATRQTLVDNFILLAKRYSPHEKGFYRAGNLVTLKNVSSRGRVKLAYWDGESSSNERWVTVSEGGEVTVECDPGLWWNYARAETDNPECYVEVNVYQQ
jgi:hypothetical protein